ncbi:ABC transporter ATP-binding protein [Thermobispora bispora]|jgi:molybdate transport system ATP-binding protein|uniref:ABC transporter ATP-binding protein n=1 Tax=Thermobispora bispora TaxID=2006 RepID=UPI00197DFD8E|nr:ABC transporter ATP-binding protein [Thermobispora bispora]MDI9582429.1 ABC transporter ATP-binding protein [Thermobispora sp.]
MSAGGTVLRARLHVAREGFRLDLPLEAAAGEVVALLGPNGAGKTTALRALAGLVRLSHGEIVLDGEPIHTLPPERRSVGMVFQDHRLFPHLSVLDNVAFGLRCRGTPKARAREIAREWLGRFGLAERAGVKPRELSGGQAQRVALARALVTRPRLLLLDEPFAALDAYTRLEVRAWLNRHLEGFDGATVLVTHDPLDAMALADRIVVIEGGSIVQQGTPAEVARHPRTDYVARLVGLNLYRGTADGRAVTVTGRAGERVVLSVAEELTGPAFVAFPPSAVALFRGRPDGTPRNLWEGTIAGLERHGDGYRIAVDGPVGVLADVTAAAVAELGLLPGQRVWVAVKATETHAYPE